MSAKRRAHLLAAALGAATAVAALALLDEAGKSPGIGPADVLGALLVGGAVGWISLPRPVVTWRRSARVFSSWCGLSLFWMITESAQVCGRTDPTCTSAGEPLRVFAIWAAGAVLLGGGWWLAARRER